MPSPIRPGEASSSARPAADDGDTTTPGPRSPPARQQSLAVRTPGQLARNARAASVPNRTPTNRPTTTAAANRSGGGNGLSASARRLRAPSVAGRATPHARRAIETFRDRRTAMLNTPGRTKGGGGGRPASAATAAARDRRRSGIVEGKGDGPLDALRMLSRRLAPLSQRVVTSSSPGDTPRPDNSSVTSEVGRRRRDPSGMFIDDDDDDDDSGFIKRRPRLSLPIDAGDDDNEAELQRPQLSGLMDDHTVLSVEAPRRAVSEQPGGWGRFDRESLRMSDFFGGHLDLSDDFGPPDDAGGLMPPPFGDMEDGDRTRRDENDTYERYVAFYHASLQILKVCAKSDFLMLRRLDSPVGRRETLGPGRQSDFGTIEVPLDVDSPFRLEPQINDTSDMPGMVFDDDDDAGGGGNSPLASGSPLAYAGQDDDAGGADDHGVNGHDTTSVDGDDGDLAEATTGTAFAAAAARRPGERLGAKAGSAKPNKKGLRLSKHGNPVPSLPPAVVKRLAEAMARTSGVVGNAKITPETLRALMQATDWFFEQVGDDLRALAHHAGRKTIETSDVAMLMKRYVLLSRFVCIGYIFVWRGCFCNPCTIFLQYCLASQGLTPDPQTTADRLPDHCLLARPTTPAQRALAGAANATSGTS